jgi:2-amino-4-hydroxy-6-hydroxymethyldihydropteridine diphosphokinase
MTAPRRAVLAVGSNLGDRLGTLQECVTAIGRLPDTEVLAISPVYETDPVGGPVQPDYLNAVLVVQTRLAPRELLKAVNQIEADLGRIRAERFGPRTLDIDIVSYAGEVSDDPVLTLPHPRAHERAFVLAPWHDIDPDAELPGRGPVAALLAGLDGRGVRRVAGAMLCWPRGGDPPGSPRLCWPRGGDPSFPGGPIPPDPPWESPRSPSRGDPSPRTPLGKGCPPPHTPPAGMP